MKKLPLDLRKELKEPFGSLITNEDMTNIKENIDKDRLIITCGDKTFERFWELDIKINLAIIDFKTKRKWISNKDQLKNMIDEKVYVSSPAGVISEELEQALRDCINKISEEPAKEIMIIVDGEEDLSYIPCVLYAPLGTYIAYGQPDQGVVVSEITEELKSKIRDIYNKMDET